MKNILYIKSYLKNMRVGKKLFTILLSVSVMLSFITPIYGDGSFDVSDFNDVRSSDWFYESVKYAVDNGMTEGTSYTTFSPQAAMTRGQFVTVLSRMDGNTDYDNRPASGFADVPSNMYYSPHISWLATNSISDLTGTNFYPERNITRQEMVIILGKYLTYKNITLPRDVTAPNAFADASRISAEALPYAETLRESGLIIGDANKNLNPSSNMTRAEGVTVFMRLDIIIQAAGNFPAPTPTPQPQPTPVPQPSNYSDEVLRLVNIERANEGISPLSAMPTLTAAAQIRADELITLFSHSRPNGTDCFTIFAETGISYSAAGENIAAGQSSPASVVNSWMNSDGHRANILNPNFTHLGVGFTQSSTGYGAYWAQLFIGQ